MKARRVKKLEPSASLAENAARIVRVRIDELRSFVPAALDPEATEAQHDMRIAAKRLRYVLEATGFCFGPAASTARRRARDLQNVLGELRDCDVMLPRVEQHLGEMRREDARAVRARAADAADLDPRLVTRAPHRTAYRGLEVLGVYLEARRGLLFDRFRELWTQQERNGTWERLDRVARERLESARELRRAATRATRAAEELAKAQAAERAAIERARRVGGVPDRAEDERGQGEGAVPDRVAADEVVSDRVAADDASADGSDFARAVADVPAGDAAGDRANGDRAQVPGAEPA
jgi:hypothetical protein